MSVENMLIYYGKENEFVPVGNVHVCRVCLGTRSDRGNCIEWSWEIIHIGKLYISFYLYARLSYYIIDIIVIAYNNNDNDNNNNFIETRLQDPIGK